MTAVKPAAKCSPDHTWYYCNTSKKSARALLPGSNPGHPTDLEDQGKSGPMPEVLPAECSRSSFAFCSGKASAWLPLLPAMVKAGAALQFWGWPNHQLLHVLKPSSCAEPKPEMSPGQSKPNTFLLPGKCVSTLCYCILSIAKLFLWLKRKRGFPMRLICTEIMFPPPQHHQVICPLSKSTFENKYYWEA